MKILVHELGLTGTYDDGRRRQRITVGDKRMDMTAIRLHLYKHLAPAGSLYVQLQDSNGVKIKDSDSVTIASISSLNYFHGMVTFDLEVSLRRNTVYWFELLSSGGYSYAAGAHIAWVQAQNSLEFQLWGWRNALDSKGII